MTNLFNASRASFVNGSLALGSGGVSGRGTLDRAGAEADLGLKACFVFRFLRLGDSGLPQRLLRSMITAEGLLKWFVG